MKLNKNKHGAFLVSAFIIYLLIYLAALKIPFHSDDYSYFLQGLSVENRVSHYLGWSGRIITDFTSSYLLNLFSYPLYTAINSLVFLIFLIVVSVLPGVVFKDSNRYGVGNALVLWLLFITYWVSNPNLGQTSFWIVGSANYLWPLMWASFYIIYIFDLQVNRINKNTKSTLLIWFLGIFAGLSNEAMGVSIVFFSFVLLFLYKYNRFYIINGLASSLFGFLVLYFSPGNYKRLAHKAFEHWNEKSFLAKVSDHLFSRFPTAISRYWFAFAIIFLIIIVVVRYKNKIYNKGKFFYPILFILLSVFSLLVFVKSPAMPARALNTGLYFIIISLSFFAYFIITDLPKKGFSAVFIVTVLGFLFFIPSYTLFYKAVANTKIQHEIRERVINEAKQEGKNVVDIPDWYFTKLFKSRDKFDTYRSGAMPGYYGIEQIIWGPAFFNYAILATQEPITINQELVDGLFLNSIYIYNEFGSSDDGLIFEFSDSLLDHIKEGDNVLYIHLYRKGSSDFINADVSIKKFTKVGNKYYYRIYFKGTNPSEIGKINFGFYNSATKKRSASFSLNFNDFNL